MSYDALFFGTFSPLITGYQMYHNYLRPHMGLDGKTPADLCGIKIMGENKWLTIIQNTRKIDNGQLHNI